MITSQTITTSQSFKGCSGVDGSVQYSGQGRYIILKKDTTQVEHGFLVSGAGAAGDGCAQAR